ncbi:MAG: hypothetical protein RL326_489 [Pseudomonadota bacterium]|jgi:hypothetical protein
MDDGHVIPSLNEDWSFAGAKLMEWMAGMTTAFLASNLFEKPAHYMPLLIIIMIGTTLTLATLRKKFPDEERGVMHLFMTCLGFAPPGIPAPARLQPRWSGGRITTLAPSSLFMQLELDEVVNKPREDQRH